MTRAALWLTLLALAPAGAGAAAPHADLGESTCVTCHEREEDPELSDAVPEWRRSEHAKAEVSCDGCHGGDPSQEDADESMSEDAGYIGEPAWNGVGQFCGSCHEEIAQGYADGTPGDRIRGGIRPPTCATCHMATGHDTGEPDVEEILADPRDPELRELHGLEQLRAALVRVKEREGESGAVVAALERRPLLPTGLREELEAIRQAYIPIFHEFDPESFAEASDATHARLARLDEAARRHDREVTRRTRYGAVVLLALGAAFAALLAWRRKLG